MLLTTHFANPYPGLCGEVHKGLRAGQWLELLKLTWRQLEVFGVAFGGFGLSMEAVGFTLGVLIAHFGEIRLV